MKEEKPFFREEVNAYEIKKEKVERRFLEKRVSVKVTILSLAFQKRSVIRLKTERSLLMKTDKELLFVRRRGLRAAV